MTIEHFDVLIVGAGLSGIGAGYHLQTRSPGRTYAILEGRDAMTRYLESDVVPKGKEFGVAIHRVGVKDVVLPGEMKVLLNQVIEAEKAAAGEAKARAEAQRNAAEARKARKAAAQAKTTAE